MTDPTEEHRRRLARDLASKRALRSPEWKRAFERVPRHLFVPRFHLEWEDRTLDGSDPQQRDEWLDVVYSDQGLITQYGPDGCSTSSSSTPSIMALMLEALDVDAGARVLEIGTGTGYNAALLCERLGSEAVTTIDVDPELVAIARERLAGAGYRPAVEVGDGFAGWPPGAAYDRVMGTCFVWPLPVAWIEQTHPGGRVLAVVPNGLAMLTVAGDGSAGGPFHAHDFGFMYMRGGHMPPRITRPERTALLSSEGETRPGRRPARIIHAGSRWSFWFWVGMFVPFAEVAWSSRTSCSVIDVLDRSWYRLDLARNEVTQGGPRRLWDQVEDLFGTWCELGAPNREDMGLTVEADGRHVLWLDRPGSGVAWELEGLQVRPEPSRYARRPARA